MIQTGQTKVTLSDGPDVTNNNDILAMNAFSALADVSIGKEICTSVEPAPPPQPTCDCATATDPSEESTADISDEASAAPNGATLYYLQYNGDPTQSSTNYYLNTIAVASDGTATFGTPCSLTG